MASVQQPLSRDSFHTESKGHQSHSSKTIPILPSASLSSQGDPMDVSQSSNAPMAPPSSTSPNGDKSRDQQQHDQEDANGNSSQPTGAAAAAQQPKVVQTAFIHKLYKFVAGKPKPSPAH